MAGRCKFFFFLGQIVISSLTVKRRMATFDFRWENLLKDVFLRVLDCFDYKER